MTMQVWNSNKHSGLVGVFHLQGAAWSRVSRQFVIHDNSPPPLTTTVRTAQHPPSLTFSSFLFAAGHYRLRMVVLDRNRFADTCLSLYMG